MRERRAYIRVPVGLEATYQIVQEMGPPRLGLSVDLSAGGMRLHQPERLTPGHEVSLSAILPRAGQVTLRGIIVWSREAVNGRGGHQAGIRWIEVSPAAQARLNAFLTEYTRSSGPAVSSIELLTPAPINWPKVLLASLVGFLFLLALSFLLNFLH